jgi:mannose-6-phosphate isomerase-like protein (cupin superfamily)
MRGTRRTKPSDMYSAPVPLAESVGEHQCLSFSSTPSPAAEQDTDPAILQCIARRAGRAVIHIRLQKLGSVVLSVIMVIGRVHGEVRDMMVDNSSDSQASEWIMHEGRRLALIIRADYDKAGITFFTPPELSQQLAFMHHPSGKIIEAHVHNRVERTVAFTQEVLIIRRGRLRVDFYSAVDCYLESRVITAGDVLLLIDGGHGFQVLEEIEMIEIKQGPHAGNGDKTRFPAVTDALLRFKSDIR